jgi:CelD/BcsL family acetyltransferase involved in cellulose biosynthesis
MLLGKKEPWAFVLGFQRNGVFHYSNIAYDVNYARLSPGTVLFYLMLEHLHEFNKPVTLNFGVGEAFYKMRFGTDKLIDCNIMVMNAGFKTALIYLWLATINNIKILRNKFTKKTISATC